MSTVVVANSSARAATAPATDNGICSVQGVHDSNGVLNFAAVEQAITRQ
jgi:hypothetical protein